MCRCYPKSINVDPAETIGMKATIAHVGADSRWAAAHKTCDGLTGDCQFVFGFLLLDLRLWLQCRQNGGGCKLLF
jgi:hypothetical protein